MGTKMAVAFANIFMGKVESQILERSTKKPLAWKMYTDDIFSIWNINRDEVTQFIEQANSHHPTIKYTAEISDTENNVPPHKSVPRRTVCKTVYTRH